MDRKTIQSIVWCRRDTSSHVLLPRLSCLLPYFAPNLLVGHTVLLLGFLFGASRCAIVCIFSLVRNSFKFSGQVLHFRIDPYPFPFPSHIHYSLESRQGLVPRTELESTASCWILKEFDVETSCYSRILTSWVLSSAFLQRGCGLMQYQPLCNSDPFEDRPLINRVPHLNLLEWGGILKNS